MDDENEKTYIWEGDYERTWEAIKEDETGSLQTVVDDILHRTKRRRLLDRPANVRLGMLLEHFLEEYFDHNPISQVGILTTSNKRANRLTELGGNPKRHIAALQKCVDKQCLKEPSLQNALELAATTLRHVPGHASREVLVILGSLTTCDPGNIHDTIKSMKDLNIRCSVIGLSADVRVCKRLCSETQGSYSVILDEPHFKEVLLEHIKPPLATASTESSLIRMGFPQHQLHAEKDKLEKPSMCMCHLDSKSTQGFSTGGYFCPQCKSKYCELPIECKACGLTLVSAPHLARSFHHLFPLESFQEIQLSDLQESDSRVCLSCLSEFKDKTVYRCARCLNLFCIDCELFIHDSLHTCPGCTSTRPKML
ncbi:general transcription factor IIH subunit 2-like [Saccoglossus kowalevskii]|uniref:General transcription factor IIH subunit 2-like n=1 Tax=Saccoglossus kowalevskii TaxID=10224 RepID=A0ABM0M0V3_SACKO|nr:PREDICTED: general transcription factor IIH subunit 2-like [Saccoglossus kowalevskii]